MLELLHKALFAFISGFSELIFVSSAAHQLLYRTVTGCDLNDSPLLLGIHLGCLVGLLVHCQKRLKQLRYENRRDRSAKHRRGRRLDGTSWMDIRILNTAVIPLLFGFFFYQSAAKWIDDPVWMALVLTINGAIIFLPRLLSSGNKNGHSLSRMDCFLMGIGGALGAVPGFSRLGCMYSLGLACGVQKSYALDISTLLSIPAVAVMICFDLYGCAVGSAGITGLQLLGAFVAALASFGGTYLGIRFIRYVCGRATTIGSTYYNWGLAMFLFFIYLFVA